jgi:Family of unknown function (DUF6384)
MSTATAGLGPLNDDMLAMDVADTLRHNRELRDAAADQQTLERLRDIYRLQGIEVSYDVLREGAAALGESRFAYVPPRPGLAVGLARLYVARKRWLPATLSILLVLALAAGGYFFVYQPYQAAQAEAARIELAVTLPAEMDGLYQTIYEETKVQSAVNLAESLRKSGKQAAADDDRLGAENAIAGLTEVRDTLRLQYQLRMMPRPGEKPGFWRFPRENSAAANYYVIVQAIDPQGNALSFPVLNEEDGRLETVSRWGLRVPEALYRAVEADYNDDGVLQRSLIGQKDFGYLEIYFPTRPLGGTLTRW